MVLRGRLMNLSLVTAAAGDIRVYFAYEDTNVGLNSQILQGVGPLLTVAAAADTLVIAGARDTERKITQMTVANAGTALNHCTIIQHDAANNVPIWDRDLLPGEKAVFTDTSGWSLYDADGVLQGARQPTDSAIVLKGLRQQALLTTGAAGDIRVSYSYTDTNNDMASYKGQHGASLPPFTSAATAPVVVGAGRTNRNITQLTLTNAGTAINHCALAVTDGAITVPLWERDLLAGETAEFTDRSGWCIYADGLRQDAAGGGSTSTTDATARALAKAAKDKVDLIFPPSGGSVPAGNVISIATTDAGIIEFKNPTAGALTVPATASKANVLAAGFIEDAVASSGLSDSVTLASLPANTWTAIPASTIVPSPTAIEVYDSANRLLTDVIAIRITAGKYELASSANLSNLTIKLEG